MKGCYRWLLVRSRLLVPRQRALSQRKVLGRKPTCRMEAARPWILQEKQPPCRGPAPPPCPAAPPSPAPEQGGASRPQPSARACHLQGSGAQRPRGSAKDSTGALAQLVSVPVPQPWLVRERREPGPEQPRPGPLCAPEPHPHPTLRSPHSRPLRQRSG